MLGLFYYPTESILCFPKRPFPRHMSPPFALGLAKSQYLTYTYDAAGNIKAIVGARNSNQKQCFS